MIEQLKVKLHELNNLSQSLNDQLVELRQQLNDRNQIFSSDSSDSSDSDVTDFMSDDYSRDSFRDSWFDSPASNVSADNIDSASNNNANQENNNTGNAEGSDVVEQVERTVVNSLFELSSRLERVRNQMRAVLNSRLVQEQNTLNDDVRIPSAAELDAIVNSNNNDNNSQSESNGQTLNDSNNGSYNTSNGNNNVNEQDRGNNNAGNDTQYFTENENQSEDGYSYGNDSQWSNHSEANALGNASDVSDLNWISDSDSNHTPSNRSPNPPSPSPIPSPTSSETSTEAYSSNRTENENGDKQNVSEHVIFSQPPYSPSDSTGSFSSIPSTSTFANSPSREQNQEDSPHGSLLSASATTNNHSSSAHSDRSYFNTTDNNSTSPISPRSHSSTLSSRNEDTNEEHSASFSNPSPAHSFTSVSSAKEENDLKSEASHYNSNENSCSSFITSPENSDHEEAPHSLSANSSPISHSSAVTDSDPGILRAYHNAELCKTGSKTECKETSCVDSSLDYGGSHEESHDVDNLSETSASCLDHPERQEESGNSGDDPEQEEKIDHIISDGSVSRCEPDSTQSPSTIQHQLHTDSFEGSSANRPVLISTATESGDSDESDSLKYLTRHVKRIEKCENYSAEISRQTEDKVLERNEVEDPGSTVDSGFITGASSPTGDISQPTENKRFSNRKRKSTCYTYVSDEYKKSKSCGIPSRSVPEYTSQSYTSGDNCGGTDSVSVSAAGRYGFRKRCFDNDNIGNEYNDCKKSKGSAGTSQYSSGQGNQHRLARTSPPRNRQSWRDASQHWRRNRTSANKRSSQTCSNNENNAQSLNVKIDLSLINYSGHIGNETTSTAIPTTAVVHSANISPIPTASSKREAGHTASRQHNPDNAVKSSTPKQDEMSHKNNHRQRSVRSQRQELHGPTRNTHSSPARGPSNINNNSSSNRDFPNSWRDSSDSSSDNTWEPGSDCNEMDDTITEGEDEFETDSSYEVQVPKSTAALLEEYASDESDESWTVGMN